MNSVLEIHPLTRVEGHGRVTVSFAAGRVEAVTLSLYESPRLFEALLLGKGPLEVPEIVCRICSLCSTVHRICSLQAVEAALQIEVSEQTRLYRELILYGGHIQSHSLHLYCLVLPDLVGTSGLAGLAGQAPEELQRGLRIKGVGNLIQEVIGGRLIHPVTLIPGGMGRPPERASLLQIRDELRKILPDLHHTVQLFRPPCRRGSCSSRQGDTWRCGLNSGPPSRGACSIWPGAMPCRWKPTVRSFRNRCGPAAAPSEPWSRGKRPPRAHWRG